MSLETLQRAVNEDIESVEEAILAEIQTDVPLLTSISDYILRSGGKRLRPVLVLLGAKVFAEVTPAVVQAAQVVEYLHTATLLHDDVVDDADQRRFKKAARTLWGNRQSVLTGDYLFALSFHKLTLLNNQQVLETISHTTELMAQGELVQLQGSMNSPDEEVYFRVIFYKTASLFASASKIGAILAGASSDDQQRLYDYGKAIGIAFQIVDDALDYAPSSATTGKPVGGDLMERKMTLPLGRLIQVASPGQRHTIENLLKQPEITTTEVERVIEWMQEHEVLDYCLKVALHYVDEAKRQLTDLPPSLPKAALEELADYILERTF